MYYKQCIFQKGNVIHIAYIPEQFAHKDKFVNIKGEDGWKIIMVAQHRMPEDAMPTYSEIYKHQRKASDI